MLKSINKATALFFTISLILFSGCDKKSPGYSESLNPNLRKAFKQLDQLQFDIETQIIFRSADVRSKGIAESYLVDLKNIIVYLSSNPYDQSQIFRGLEISERLEKLFLPITDKARVLPVLWLYNQGISQLALKHKIDISAWKPTLFSYDFGDDLAPFWSVSNKDLTWTTKDGNAVNTQTKATARSNKFDVNQAWLVSPQFDLSLISNPFIVLRHSIQISRGEGFFNTAQLLEQGYKLLISENYEFGSPLQFCNFGDSECLLAKNSQGEEILWRPLDFKKPKGDDFHMTTTNPVSIENYAGKDRVFIALLLNFDSKNTQELGKHFNTWDLFEFKLLGSGLLPPPRELPPPPPPIPSLFEALFDEDSLLPFESIGSSPEANNWRRGEFRQTPFAGITSNGTATKTRLVASGIFLESKDEISGAQLFFDHTINAKSSNYDIWTQLKVKTSLNYRPGMPIDEATWVDLTFSDKEPLSSLNKFLNFSAGPIDMSEYFDQEFSLAFEFSSEAGDNYLWQVKNIKIVPEFKSGDGQ